MLGSIFESIFLIHNNNTKARTSRDKTKTSKISYHQNSSLVVVDSLFRHSERC